LFINRIASPEEARQMIRAYLACISYVDWNVGRVISELEKQGLKENTIIVFWSDHGYQLGEKGKWSKAGSLWEQGTRVPFIIFLIRGQKAMGKLRLALWNFWIFTQRLSICVVFLNPKDLKGQA